MNMRVADMTEDDVLAWKLPLEGLPINRNHLPIALEGNREIGIHLQDTSAADQIVHRFR